MVPQISVDEENYTYNDNGTPVTVTQISYKSRNLGGNSKRLATPFEIMRNFDRRVNSIFEDFFKESIGIRHILSEMEKDEEEFEKRIKKDFFGENNALSFDDKDEDKEENNNEDNNDVKNEGDNKLQEKKKRVKKIGKLSIDEDKMRNAMNKKKIDNLQISMATDYRADNFAMLKCKNYPYKVESFVIDEFENTLSEFEKFYKNIHGVEKMDIDNLLKDADFEKEYIAKIDSFIKSVE